MQGRNLPVCEQLLHPGRTARQALSLLMKYRFEQVHDDKAGAFHATVFAGCVPLTGRDLTAAVAASSSISALAASASAARHLDSRDSAASSAMLACSCSHCAASAASTSFLLVQAVVSLTSLQHSNVLGMVSRGASAALLGHASSRLGSCAYAGQPPRVVPCFAGRLCMHPAMPGKLHRCTRQCRVRTSQPTPCEDHQSSASREHNGMICTVNPSRRWLP